jgi:membrane protein YdbS with pleckstrin-like domain
MLFENRQIDSNDLPSVDQLNFIPLEKRYLKVSLISSAIFWVIIIVAGTLIYIFKKDEIPGLIQIVVPLVLFLFFMLSLYLLIQGFYKKEYALRQKDIIYKSGFIWQKEVALPFNRVQHCEVNQGPIERMFNLSSLHVFTAGGSSSDLNIPGLNPDTAKQLKEFIVKKTVSDEEE